MRRVTRRAESLPALLEHQASRRPASTWLEEIDGRRVTYGEGLVESRLWAAAWRRAGVGQGDVVVTMQHHTIDSVLSWVGLAWIGAIESPVNTDYRGDLLLQVLEQTRATIVVVREEWLERVLDLSPRLSFLRKVVVVDATASEETRQSELEIVSCEELLADGLEPLVCTAPEPWDTACILHTSGTTGPSKGSLMPWGQLHAFPSQEDSTARWRLDSDDVILSWGPSYHLPAKIWPHQAALLGAKTLMRPYLRLSTVAEDAQLASFMQLLPQIIDHLLTLPRAADPTIREKRFWGGAASGYPRFDEFKRRFGLDILLLFGMTETGLAPLWCWDDEVGGTDGSGRTVCGRAHELLYPYLECRVVDEYDQEVLAGTVGELVVLPGVPWVMSGGYAEMPIATLETWRNGAFHTGDAVVMDERGYVYFVDRIKDSIRRRGENISSLEVEAAVRSHPGVAECAAVAARLDGDEEVRIFVRLVEEEQALTPARLIEYLIEKLPRFMVPRFVDFVESLPRTPTQKVRKVALRGAPITDSTWDRVEEGVVVPR